MLLLLWWHCLALFADIVISMTSVSDWSGVKEEKGLKHFLKDFIGCYQRETTLNVTWTNRHTLTRTPNNVLAKHADTFIMMALYNIADDGHYYWSGLLLLNGGCRCCCGCCSQSYDHHCHFMLPKSCVSSFISVCYALTFIITFFILNNAIRSLARLTIAFLLQASFCHSLSCHQSSPLCTSFI